MSDLLTSGDAVISACGHYRYWLSRTWSVGPAVNFIMLNPSTADAADDDPTVRRCVSFARAWGYGEIFITNLFAFRATDPQALKIADDPIGPENLDWLFDVAIRSRLRVAAWGTHGGFMSQGDFVRRALDAIGPLHHLGLTKDGHPKHPLYLPRDLEPIELLDD